MQYTNLGKTGMKVSRLCLGMMSYGAKSWREWILEEKEAEPFVQRALDAGINFFDTADVYSLGESEKVLGNLMKKLGVKRETVVIATKVYQQMSDDPNDRGLSRKHIMDSIDKSLKRLQMDHTWVCKMCHIQAIPPAVQVLCGDRHPVFCPCDITLTGQVTTPGL